MLNMRFPRDLAKPSNLPKLFNRQLFFHPTENVWNNTVVNFSVSFQEMVGVLNSTHISLGGSFFGQMRSDNQCCEPITVLFSQRGIHDCFISGYYACLVSLH